MGTVDSTASVRQHRTQPSTTTATARCRGVWIHQAMLWPVVGRSSMEEQEVRRRRGMLCGWMTRWGKEFTAGVLILLVGVTQSLPHLKTLLLAENMMKSSSLSNDNLQHLSYLHTLDISQNKMTGYLAPSTIQRFPSNIKTLDMSFNHLQGIRGSTFRPLAALLALNLQGNLIEEIEDFSFLGLVSLTTLDLSHNNILTLADESLAGLPTMETLFLSHNHLQVVSGLWLVGTPLLRELLVMDNDITNVEEDAFAGLKNIQEINLARNPLSCDCHMSSFHSFLISTPSLSNSTLLSSLCSTPVYLTNTPLYQLPLPLDCEETPM